MMKTLNKIYCAFLAVGLVGLSGCEQATKTDTAATKTDVVEQAQAKQETENTQAFVQHYEGKVTGYDFQSYPFEGKKGQTLIVKLVTQGNVDAFLYGYDDYSYGEAYTLPETGQYELRVGQPRAASYKGKTSSYELTIELK
ncbi:MULTISPECIES: PPC domain-containing protein [unclassified Avibacterium]|uniref:PPC domain-containing protein n=1 Tax=unclassified Avibacterium TaxID=2685287 RepID=UPI002025C3BF|nr:MULTISPECIES: PPC domain-containing protein [unclassified Avibacterium]MCW9718622.1 PPC domain-containing protein [Avibacterium sp. 21-599]URL07399.1 PPC domain-containing protein [Avibacterium sp. 21-595]